jgi:hypothetical protein
MSATLGGHQHLEQPVTNPKIIIIIIIITVIIHRYIFFVY